MVATLRQRNFFLLWLAGLISITGNWMLFIALPVTVYAMTGSALAVGGLLLARTLPSILFSSIGGVLVDRWERRKTLVAVNLLLAITLLPLLLVTSTDMLWLIYAVTFVQSLFGQLFAPAENAMLPLLSDSEHLVSANALNALNNNLARLIGPAIGGILAPLVGLSGVAIVDAITFIVAGLLCALITVTSHPAVENTDDDTTSRRIFGTFSFTSSLFTLVGIAITGLLADNIGIVPVINIQAYAYFLLGICILRAFWKQPSGTTTLALNES